MGNIPNLDLVNINASAKFGFIPSIHSQVWRLNEILTIIKGHSNPNLDLVRVKEYAKFDHHFTRYWAETKLWQ